MTSQDGVEAWIDQGERPMIKTGVRVCVPMSECDKPDHTGDWRVRTCYTCPTDLCSSIDDLHLIPLCRMCYRTLIESEERG